MSLNLCDNDPFYKKQTIRTRRRRLQESSRLGYKNLHPELEPLPLLKGISKIFFSKLDSYAQIQI